jgi:hypothetical protein
MFFDLADRRHLTEAFDEFCRKTNPRDRRIRRRQPRFTWRPGTEQLMTELLRGLALGRTVK